MAHETTALAHYAASLRPESIPVDVSLRARDMVIDTVGAMLCGSAKPWSAIVLRRVAQSGAGGSAVMAPGMAALQPGAAALVNGCLAHAFEMDCLTHPSAGSHPGATLVPAGLAMAQHVGASGTQLLAALVAGVEVLNRIGRAGAMRPPFHMPGLIGPFGSAVTAGYLLGLNATAMAHALGLAGSMGAGLLEFTTAGRGAMVKRLHLGRSAESGVLAALLAADGFTGPDTALEGGLGYLAAICKAPDATALTRALGTVWETRTVSFKRFACHISAHLPVQLLLDLRAEHGFGAADITGIDLTGPHGMAHRNNIPAPGDLMMAQYSVNFSLALSLVRDPCDPASFDETALDDPEILRLCGLVRISEGNGVAAVVHLIDGRVITGRISSYPGMPDAPLDETQLLMKFRLSTGNKPHLTRLGERLLAVGTAASLEWIAAQ
jgi:2-methylcitrate dehydratase PrpD